jgi:hypothetical protein
MVNRVYHKSKDTTITSNMRYALCQRRAFREVMCAEVIVLTN